MAFSFPSTSSNNHNDVARKKKHEKDRKNNNNNNNKTPKKNRWALGGVVDDEDDVDKEKASKQQPSHSLPRSPLRSRTRWSSPLRRTTKTTTTTTTTTNPRRITAVTSRIIPSPRRRRTERTRTPSPSPKSRMVGNQKLPPASPAPSPFRIRMKSFRQQKEETPYSSLNATTNTSTSSDSRVRIVSPSPRSRSVSVQRQRQNGVFVLGRGTKHRRSRSTISITKSAHPATIRASGSMELDNFLNSDGGGGVGVISGVVSNIKKGAVPNNSYLRLKRASTTPSSPSTAAIAQDLLRSTEGSPQQILPFWLSSPEASPSSSFCSLLSDRSNSNNNNNEDSFTLVGELSAVPSIFNDEPSLATMPAGNLSNGDTSSALTSLVCLSLIHTNEELGDTSSSTRSSSKTKRRQNQKNDFPPGTCSVLSDGGAEASTKGTIGDEGGSSSNNMGSTTSHPDSDPQDRAVVSSTGAIVRASLIRHMRFHLDRVCGRFEQDSVDSDDDDGSNKDLSSNDESSFSSFASSTDEDTSSLDSSESPSSEHHNPDQVHYKAQDSLYRGNTGQAITIYRQLLAKQHKNMHAQRADTLSRLTVLCLIKGGRPYFKRALRYSSEARNLHKGNARPLQAALGTMELGLVHFAAGETRQALKCWREAMQLACVAMGYDHPHVAVLLNNIGLLHFQTGDHAGSVRALEESVQLQRNTLRYCCSPINVENSMHQMATTMSNLAVVHDRGLCHYDRSLSYMQESLSLHGSVHTYKDDRMEETLKKYMKRLETSMSLSPQSSSMINTRTRNAARLSGRGFVPGASQAVIRSASVFGNNDGIPTKLESENNHDFLLLGPLENELNPEQRVHGTILSWFEKPVIDVGENNNHHHEFISFDDKNLRSFHHSTRTYRSIPVDLDDENVVNAELHLREIHQQVFEHIENDEIEDALDLFYSVMRSHRHKYGDIHHLVGTTLHNIGMLQMLDKRYNHAQASFLEAMNIRSAALGTTHSDVLSSKMKLALILLAEGKIELSYESFKDILVDNNQYNIVQQQSQRQVQILAKLLNNIGVVAYCRGDLEEATQSLEIAREHLLKLRRKEEEKRAPATELETQQEVLLAVAYAHTTNNLAFVSAKNRDTTQALELFKEASSIYKNYLSEYDPVLIATLENVQFMELAKGRRGLRGNICNEEGCQIISPILQGAHYIAKTSYALNGYCTQTRK